MHALYLYDRDSQKKFREYAQRVAGGLGINFEIRSITALANERQTYKPFAMKLLAVLPTLNRLIILSAHPIYHILLRENPYALTLKKGGTARSPLARLIFRALPGPVEASFNHRHQIRKEILERYAAEKNLLLIGAANRSESFVGWFVKDGVDDLPIEPLLGLYKNQVRQLGRYLGVPEEIVSQVPMPDMLKGVGDEAMVGYSYNKIDRVAYVVEHGLRPEVAFEDGVSPKEFSGISALHELSAWKRGNGHVSPNLE